MPRKKRKTKKKNISTTFYKKNVDKINNILSLTVFILALYLILFPFLPGITLWFKTTFDSTNGYEYQSNLAKSENIDPADLNPLPEGNRIIIPKIDINGQIYEGDDPETLNFGIWKRPKTSTPKKGGNTVLISHRRLYSLNPDTFYNLPKLEIGDKFAIFWEGKEYDYIIYETAVVEPKRTEYEANTAESIVTLYTCTFDSKRRIIVRAKLIDL